MITPNEVFPGHLPPRQLGPPGTSAAAAARLTTGPSRTARGAGGRDRRLRPFRVGRLHPHAGLWGQGRAWTWLFAKLYAGSHLCSDRWYKLGRTLLYGRLEDEKPFNTVRWLVQQEDYALRLMHGAGVRSPEPFGIVEITPEREYLVVTEFFDDAQEIGDLDQVDDGIIDDGLRIIRHL